MKKVLEIWGVKQVLSYLDTMDINCNLFFVRKMYLKTAWLLGFWAKKFAPFRIVLYTFKWEKNNTKERSKFFNDFIKFYRQL